MTNAEVHTRSQAIRISLFNHKGGVGKTTLTVNIAETIARLGKKVLLVDTDPQCNLTIYKIDELVVNDLLDKSESAEGRTIWTALKPIFEGSGDIKVVSPWEIGHNLFLLPGDIRLAEFENRLSNSWLECMGRQLRGYREMTAISRLIDKITLDNNIDFVFYDSGPNIGNLNRCILLDSDYFIIPAACDLFSLSAIKTLGHTLSVWIKDWQTITDFAPDGIYLFPGMPKLLGYIPQRFRVWGGGPSEEYAKFFPRIEREVQSEIVTRLLEINKKLVPNNLAYLKLGEIKDFGSIANKSQTTGTSIPNESFQAIAKRIISETSRDAI